MIQVKELLAHKHKPCGALVLTERERRTDDLIYVENSEDDILGGYAESKLTTYYGEPISKEEAASLWTEERASNPAELEEIVRSHFSEMTLCAGSGELQPQAEEQVAENVTFEYECGAAEERMDAIAEDIAQRLSASSIEFEEDSGFVRVAPEHSVQTLAFIREVIGKRLGSRQRRDAEIARSGPGNDDRREFSVHATVTFGVSGAGSEWLDDFGETIESRMERAGLKPERLTTGDDDLTVDTFKTDEASIALTLELFRKALFKHAPSENLGGVTLFHVTPDDIRIEHPISDNLK